MYDSDTSSASYGTARITLPSSPALTDDNGNLRPLVACFATSEGVNESPTAQDYMLLSDGLEVPSHHLSLQLCAENVWSNGERELSD